MKINIIITEDMTISEFDQFLNRLDKFLLEETNRPFIRDIEVNN